MSTYQMITIFFLKINKAKLKIASQTEFSTINPVLKNNNEDHIFTP